MALRPSKSVLHPRNLPKGRSTASKLFPKKGLLGFILLRVPVAAVRVVAFIIRNLRPLPKNLPISPRQLVRHRRLLQQVPSQNRHLLPSRKPSPPLLHVSPSVRFHQFNRGVLHFQLRQDNFFLDNLVRFC